MLVLLRVGVVMEGVLHVELFAFDTRSRFGVGCHFLQHLSDLVFELLHFLDTLVVD